MKKKQFRKLIKAFENLRGADGRPGMPGPQGAAGVCGRDGVGVKRIYRVGGDWMWEDTNDGAHYIEVSR